MSRLAQVHALRERRRQASPRDVSARHAEELRELARDVLRLSPRQLNPEQFFIEKECAIDRLIALARRIEAGA